MEAYKGIIKHIHESIRLADNRKDLDLVESIAKSEIDTLLVATIYVYMEYYRKYD
jgi:hypothetical protein